MKALTVTPRVAHSAIVRADHPEPALDVVADGRGVKVRVFRVGLDGTDKEIDAGKYGAAPPGFDYLITGHEGFGVVTEVGHRVTEVQPGDFVVSIVRQPGDSVYDRIGLPDFTTDDTYHEHGINLVHGFLTEAYVERADQLVLVPAGLREVGVLLEPTTVVEKGIAQAFEIQRRLKVWHPKRAAVLGAGTIGLLAAMVLRLRGLDVTVFGREHAPYLNSDLVDALGARYLSTEHTSLDHAAAHFGPFDLMFEATGFSPLVFEAMGVLGRNGVLVLSSVTGGDRRVEVPSDALNLGFVLGNKVMVGTVNASRADFESGVRDTGHGRGPLAGLVGAPAHPPGHSPRQRARGRCPVGNARRHQGLRRGQPASLARRRSRWLLVGRGSRRWADRRRRPRPEIVQLAEAQGGLVDERWQDLLDAHAGDAPGFGNGNLALPDTEGDIRLQRPVILQAGVDDASAKLVDQPTQHLLGVLGTGEPTDGEVGLSHRIGARSTQGTQGRAPLGSIDEMVPLLVELLGGQQLDTYDLAVDPLTARRLAVAQQRLFEGLARLLRPEAELERVAIRLTQCDRLQVRQALQQRLKRCCLNPACSAPDQGELHDYHPAGQCSLPMPSSRKRNVK